MQSQTETDRDSGGDRETAGETERCPCVLKLPLLAVARRRVTGPVDGGRGAGSWRWRVFLRPIGRRRRVLHGLRRSNPALLISPSSSTDDGRSVARTAPPLSSPHGRHRRQHHPIPPRCRQLPPPTPLPPPSLAAATVAVGWGRGRKEEERRRREGVPFLIHFIRSMKGTIASGRERSCNSVGFSLVRGWGWGLYVIEKEPRSARDPVRCARCDGGVVLRRSIDLNQCRSADRI